MVVETGENQNNSLLERVQTSYRRYIREQKKRHGLNEREKWQACIDDARNFGLMSPLKTTWVESAFNNASRFIGRALPVVSVFTGIALPPVESVEASSDYLCDVGYNIESVGINGNNVDLVSLNSLELAQNPGIEELFVKYGDFSSRFPGVGLHYALAENASLTNGDIAHLTSAIENLKLSMELIESIDPELSKIFTGYTEDKYEFLPEEFQLPIVLTPHTFMAEAKRAGYIEGLPFCNGLDSETGISFSPEYMVIDMNELVSLNPNINVDSQMWEKKHFAWVMHMVYHEFEHLYQTTYLQIDQLGDKELYYDNEMMAEASSIIFRNELSKVFNIPEFSRFAFRNLVGSEITWEYVEGEATFELEVQGSPYSQGELLGVYGIESDISMAEWREYEKAFVEHVQGLSIDDFNNFVSKDSNIGLVFRFLRNSQYEDDMKWGEWLLDFTLRHREELPTYDNYFSWSERWNANLTDMTLDWELPRFQAPATITLNKRNFELRAKKDELNNYVVPIVVPQGYEFAIRGIESGYHADNNVPLSPYGEVGLVNVGPGTYYLLAAEGVDEIIITPGREKAR